MIGGLSSGAMLASGSVPRTKEDQRTISLDSPQREIPSRPRFFASGSFRGVETFPTAAKAPNL